MGIDVYLHWRGMTDAEKRAQYTGYNTEAGSVGYLREAYHGSPYATQALVPEGWEEDMDDFEGIDGFSGIPIEAAVLRQRLPAVVLLSLYRNHMLYEQGRTPGAIDADRPVEGLLKAANRAFSEMQDRSAIDLAESIRPDQIEKAEAIIKSRRLPGFALAFVDFVELAERKQLETGEPCRILVSA